MCVTEQWLVLLLLVEYSYVSQHSGLFYFYWLNIHMCHSTVAFYVSIVSQLTLWHHSAVSM